MSVTTENSTAQVQEATPVLSTEDARFDDIRHYKDCEVTGAIGSILDNDTVIGGISKYMFPKMPKFCEKLLRPFVKCVLKRRFSKVKTIRDVQEQVAQFMRGIIRDTTDGFSYSGFERLDPKKGDLFISNHRDISMDPALINMACFAHNLDTVKIAIGDNLLKLPVATDLMKLNKSFIVKRSLSSVKEKIKAFSELSEYIGIAVRTEHHNVWIAQREGRAKDGDDETEVAIIKMFYMYGKKQGLSFEEYVKSLNIVPVSITYEYDPGDESKARQLYESSINGSYTKGKMEDIESIVGGIKGYKGHVHISAGAPLTGDYATPQELAAEIDRYVHKHYRMTPSIQTAAGKTEGLPEAEVNKFNARINAMPAQLQPIVRSMYAKAYENHEKAMSLVAKH